jgi:hypothetical protein
MDIIQYLICGGALLVVLAACIVYGTTSRGDE